MRETKNKKLVSTKLPDPFYEIGFTILGFNSILCIQFLALGYIFSNSDIGVYDGIIERQRNIRKGRKVKLEPENSGIGRRLLDSNLTLNQSMNIKNSNVQCEQTQFS